MAAERTGAETSPPLWPRRVRAGCDQFPRRCPEAAEADPVDGACPGNPVDQGDFDGKCRLSAKGGGAEGSAGTELHGHFKRAPTKRMLAGKRNRGFCVSRKAGPPVG